jgi:hypothetical protein
MWAIVVSLAGPFATIVAASVAVFVTWRLGSGQLSIAKQQAATAQQQAELAAVRLQHDLFDRRFAIYEAAQKLVKKYSLQTCQWKASKSLGGVLMRLYFYSIKNFRIT